MRDILYSVVTLLLSVTEKNKSKNKADVVKGLSSTYYESCGNWEIVSTWLDTSGEQHVLHTLKQQGNLVTLFNEKQLFIHGFSATYGNVKRHHEWVRKQITQQAGSFKK